MGGRANNLYDYNKWGPIPLAERNLLLRYLLVEACVVFYHFSNDTFTYALLFASPWYTILLKLVSYIYYIIYSKPKQDLLVEQWYDFCERHVYVGDKLNNNSIIKQIGGPGYIDNTCALQLYYKYGINGPWDMVFAAREILKCFIY